MSHKQQRTVICPRCRKAYILGQTGIDEGCDSCLGVQRDVNGYAWLPGEVSKTLVSTTTGEARTVQRPRNFRRAG